MTPNFGTSGLRGLVTGLTPDCVSDYVAAFIASCDVGQGVYVGHDLRASSPDIYQMVIQSVLDCGCDVYACGAVPTPALALVARRAAAGAIMVTGSHIPADRNGLKFYTRQGEITKTDEAAIINARGKARLWNTQGYMTQVTDAGETYQQRYISAFAGAFRGMRIGVYGHSAVGRDLIVDLLTEMGADVIRLGYCDTFIPVDTEAVDHSTRVQFAAWAQQYGCDAIVSTDADGDRPLVTDEQGRIIAGDILGQITATYLGADYIVTPVSSNTGVDSKAGIATVIRTKIGSPYVINAMCQGAGRVAGYEANGGFLLGFDAQGPVGAVDALMTRDALLPIIAVLAAGRPVSQVVLGEPARFTAANRLANIPAQKSQSFIQQLCQDCDIRAGLLQATGGAEAAVNRTDGVRITRVDGRIIHFRPSGNAPEMRIYTEAETQDAANALLGDCMEIVGALLV